MKYRCVLTNKNGRQVVSDEAEMTFGPLTIEEQPKDIETSVGKPVKLYVGAGGPVQNYQWEFQWANEDQWHTWGTGNGFETGKVNAKWQGLKYRCIISDGAGKSLTSEIGTITLGTLNITEQPQDQTIQDGKPVILSMGAEGEGISYQWQCHWANENEWRQWGTGNGFESTPANIHWQGMKYRCILTNKNGRQEVSSEATIHIEMIPQVLISFEKDEMASVSVNNTANLIANTVNATGIQWQTSDDGESFTDQEGMTDTTFRVINTDGKYQVLYIRAIVTSETGNTSESNIVKVTLLPEDETPIMN